MPSPGMFGALYQGPQNWSDRLALIGAGIKDASPASPGGNLEAARNFLMQRQMAQYQMGMMGRMGDLIKPAQPAQYDDAPPINIQAPPLPGSPPDPTAPVPPAATPGDAAMPVGAPASPAASAPYAYHLPTMTAPPTSGGLNIMDPETQRTLSMAAALGLPGAKDMIDLGKATMPQFDTARPGTQMYNKLTGKLGQKVSAPEYVNGFRVDPTDPSGPSFVPQLDKMTMPDGKGGVMPVPGAVDTTGALAGATTNAQEAGKAAWDLVDVPLSNGGSVKLPRSVAVAVLAQRAAANGGALGGQPGIAGGPDATLGMAQTPADKALAEEQAKLQAQRNMAQPQKAATLSDADRTADFSRSTIHDILGETQNPKTGQWVKTKPSQVNWATTGALGATDEIPGTPAHNLKAKLDTILSQTAVSELQKMRDESPTGGALGRVTQQEINMLAAMRGSIEQTQSGGQLETSLRHHLSQLDKLATIRDRLYASEYPSGQPGAASPAATAPPPPSREAIAAELRRRGLLK